MKSEYEKMKSEMEFLDFMKEILEIGKYESKEERYCERIETEVEIKKQFQYI